MSPNRINSYGLLGVSAFVVGPLFGIAAPQGRAAGPVQAVKRKDRCQTLVFDRWVGLASKTKQKSKSRGLVFPGQRADYITHQSVSARTVDAGRSNIMC